MRVSIVNLTSKDEALPSINEKNYVVTLSNLSEVIMGWADLRYKWQETSNVGGFNFAQLYRFRYMQSVLRHIITQQPM